MRFFAVLAGIGLLAGCFESKLTYCDNGAICPETLACTERTPTPCGETESVAACRDKSDRTACSSSSEPVGSCLSGLCGPCNPGFVECRYPTWMAMESKTTKALKAVWAASSTEVFAVGDGGTVLHYDGTAWSVQAELGGGAPVLTGVWGSSPQDVFAIAQDGRLFHFDGAWQDRGDISTEPLLGLWGAGPDDVFAVGFTGTIIRISGGGTVAMTSNTGATFYAVSGTTAADITAAGSVGVIQHYNGSNWGPAPSTPLTGVTFYGVWVSPTSKVVAVGYQASNSVIEVKEANAWNRSTAPTSALRAVWGVDDTNIYTVGDTGVIAHFDGATWTPMAAIPTTNQLNAISGSAEDVFVVGEAGVILRLSH